MFATLQIQARKSSTDHWINVPVGWSVKLQGQGFELRELVDKAPALAASGKIVDALSKARAALGQNVAPAVVELAIIAADEALAMAASV